MTTITYDSTADALYVALPTHPHTDGCVKRVLEFQGGSILLDHDENGQIIGIEILGAGRVTLEQGEPKR